MCLNFYYINNIINIMKRFIKILVTLIIIESIYLYVFPLGLEKIAQSNRLQNIISSKTNIKAEYNKLKIKTHIKPDITIKTSKLSLTDKNINQNVIYGSNITLKISLWDLIFKKINLKNLTADYINLNIERDKNGVFNFEKLFNSSGKKSFKAKIKKNNININNLNINIQDETLNKDYKITANPFLINAEKNKKLEIKTVGNILSNQEKSDFDLDMIIKLPVSKAPETDAIKGSCLIYNLDIKNFEPFIKNYVNKDIQQLQGIFEYIQISTVYENEHNQIILNTKFKNLQFNYKDWEDKINASGENIVNGNIEIHNNLIKINSFNYKADKVNGNLDGKIITSKEQKPYLDLNIKVDNSKAENIVPLLPPNLPVEYRTTGKIKRYGVFGDVEGKLNIKGNIPHPDITGYMTGKNVHILDKSLHKLHKGTINLNFDKRILNMDILVNLFDNQQAKVNGSIHMYRDGVNHVTVKTTDNIDFPLAQKIIIPISKVFNFQLGPITEMDITSGKGIIDLDIQGSMDFISINGYSSFDKAKLTYNGLFGEVYNGKGRLDFKNDVITFKTERAFVKTNPLKINGKVRINGNLDFDIISEHAQADDLLEIINKSSLLKDVKEGLAVITGAKGVTQLFVNMKAKIVPVPFGQPPLPPEEAFEDMKVKGSLYMFSDSCFIEGFKTPIESIKGIVDFTETEVNLNELTAVSGTSPLKISGKIINDLQTKIPDINILITSNNVNLKDTIKFLTKSYLYPENYPDLSSLYNIASKHDLYFTYKAKSIDFLTDKAYAVMNFIPDKENNPIKAKSGRIILDKSTVKVENVNADLLDANLTVNGEVLKVDTVNPVYNLKIHSDNVNLEKLNDINKITILPPQLKQIFNQFNNYKGKADINLNLMKNIPNGDILFKNISLNHIKTGIPFKFDNFKVFIKDNKILINSISADIGTMPFFGNLTISNLNKIPAINGYYTSKITNTFIKNYLPKEFSQNLDFIGDIIFTGNISGNENSINFEPRFVMNPEADIIYQGANFGETAEKREFNGKFIIQKDKIDIKKFNYIKYINSQNNKTYPMIFSTLQGILTREGNNYVPEKIDFKTNKNISARILNLFLKNPIIKQGTFNCDLKYDYDKVYKTAKLLGSMDCRNLDLTLFDTLLKNIKINAQKDEININLFGYMADSKLNIKSAIVNNLTEKPKIKSLSIYSDYFDSNKFLEHLSKINNAMNTNNKIKNIDLAGLTIDNGSLEVKELTIRALMAENLKSDFSIDKNGIFTANNMQIDVGQGKINGKLSYNLTKDKLKGNFVLNNVDSNYVAQTMFAGENQIYGNANGEINIQTKGILQGNEEIIKNLSGDINFEILDGRMPKLGSLEYLLRAGNIIKSGITGLTLNSILEILNLVKTGYFSKITGSCSIKNGIADNIEIFSTGENLSLYIHGKYDIANTNADMEVLGKLSKRISTIFGKVGNTSLNTFFKLIPGISLLDFGKKDFIENVEKIPSFTNGDYESRMFQAVIDGNINSSSYVQSFKWIKQ